MSNTLQKILYVEDDESIAEIVKMSLEDIGDFEVLHCFSGITALKEVENFSPQLVLMDVMMPDMDGPETMLRMKAMPSVADIPIIFMTARAQVQEQKQYMDLGAIGVIVKPFDPITLCDRIRDMWEKS
ncbi:response regulator [Ahrensia kielensis]|uniref:response regulator n=1 Tax=Ahrensia kielensis TaxID=76980 RepID=UPI00036BFFEA|nr:response regulator [Ahrensia kielensis]